MLKYFQINSVVSLNYIVVWQINGVVLWIHDDDLRISEDISMFRRWAIYFFMQKRSHFFALYLFFHTFAKHSCRCFDLKGRLTETGI